MGTGGAPEAWSIRPATAADAPAVRSVLVAAGTAAWGSFLGEERIERANREREHPADLVAEDRLGVLGFVAWDAGSGEILRLYTHPRAWGRGAGKALLDRALDALRAAGCRQAWLNTEERNARGAGFYERLGWRRSGPDRVRDWHGARLREPRYVKDLHEWDSAEHALSYLARADGLPHRTEGEGVLLDHVPRSARRILDLGTGDGRLLALLKVDRPESRCVGLDLSRPMLEAARERFAGDGQVELIEHDMANALPDLGSFDAIVSSFAIHHTEDDRKRVLYEEIFERLAPGGVFANLEHVASPTDRLHRRFVDALGGGEDASNRLLDVETQLGWLREIGFEDVDCYWKWLEMALLIGVKPG